MPMTITRFALATLLGAALGATPAFANNDRDQRVSQAPSSGCSSYERAEDGSWRQIPCVSAGAAVVPSRAKNAGSQASN